MRPAIPQTEIVPAETDVGHDLANRVSRFLSEPENDDFESLAFSIFDFQKKANRPFSRFCEYLRIAPNSWKDLPAVPQQAFKHSDLRTSLEPRFEFRTSGTTGENFGRHYFPSLNLYEASVQRGWDFSQLPRHRFFLLMQSPEQAPFSSLSRMGAILSKGRTESFYFGPDGRLDSDRLQENLTKEVEPVVVFGTALALLHLLEETDSEFRLAAGSIVVETGGFKGSGREISKTQLYEKLSTRFGISEGAIWNEYGMTELSSQLYTSGVGQPHRPPPWVRCLVIDPLTGREARQGQAGLLRLFDLANVWSVLGVQTQDLALGQGDQQFLLLGRDPAAVPRGCSRAIDELIHLVR
jgi:hypothetical protein